MKSFQSNFLFIVALKRNAHRINIDQNLFLKIVDSFPYSSLAINVLFLQMDSSQIATS